MQVRTKLVILVLFSKTITGFDYKDCKNADDYDWGSIEAYVDPGLEDEKDVKFLHASFGNEDNDKLTWDTVVIKIRRVMRDEQTQNNLHKQQKHSKGKAKKY